MSKFNRTRLPATSPVKASRGGTTHEGGPGHARDTKSELFLLAVANMVGEQTFYEAANERDARFRTLVGEVALTDSAWLTRMIGWLRNDAGMRTASVVAAAEAVMARLCASLDGGNRQLIDAALRRADEPGELLAYWTGRYGRGIPKPVKRGIGDAVRRLYDERSLAKYDSGTFRFGDVLELTHPKPASAEQGDLFKHAIDRRHGRDEQVPASLKVLRARAELLALPVAERRGLFSRPDAVERLRAAGMTWESVAGWLQGPLDAQVWEALIPSMGYFALLRNLRNFDAAGVSDEVAERVAERLVSGTAGSRVLPMRYLSAYRAVTSDRWAQPLSKALDASLANVPSLGGRTLILVDRSGSMFYSSSERSQLTYADTAAVFGTALALRAQKADLVEFGSTHRRVEVGRGDSVLKTVARFTSLGGTETAAAVRAHYRRHDRVVIVTDEQVWPGGRGADPTHQVPAKVPVYTWNLVGYRQGHGPSGTANRHAFGGLSDQGFAMIPLLERDRDAPWPF
ncbi:TROVE domain-containing protein [Actinocorallia populi]|uniref:TROVE domain-containing protein n=1 Tax=Actinocorallia populi TaxID=2079200 RepID=UPI000D08E4EF|nr:TROVE domain-containing protein [Actinocorallia populi]